MTVLLYIADAICHIYFVFTSLSLTEGAVGVFMPCCLDISLAHQFGECVCFPLLPASSFAMRVAFRERFKIRVSQCSVFLCAELRRCRENTQDILRYTNLHKQSYSKTTKPLRSQSHSGGIVPEEISDLLYCI